MPQKLCLLICEYFAQEAWAVLNATSCDDVTLATFAGHCGRIPLTWENLVQAATNCEDNNHIYVIGGHCLTTLDKHPKALSHVTLDQAPQCFYRLTNRAIVDHYLETGAYLLSPSWLANWPAQIATWGFDQNQARKFFAEFAQRLVLLDTGISPHSRDHLEAFATFLDLPFKQLNVGLDVFQAALLHIVDQWRWQIKKDRLTQESRNSQQRAAEYAMALDLASMMAELMTESEAIDQIFDLFKSLFAPALVAYLPRKDATWGDIKISASTPVETNQVRDRILQFDLAQTWLELEAGFMLRIGHGEQVLGILLIDHIAFAAYKERYINLALAVAGICGLAVNNTRTYRQTRRAQQKLRDYNERLENLVDEKIQELELERAKSLQASKLAAIGELATGVAHELNQPLTAMLFDADYLKQWSVKAQEQIKSDVMDLSDVHEISTNLIQDINRCTRIINHLRTFGRVPSSEPIPVNVNQVIEDSLILTRERLQQHGVHLHLDLASTLPIIQAHPQKLEQVFLNLISNAEYALTQRAAVANANTYRKTLDITTATEAEAVIATVHDNGGGIPDEHQEHLFEPFFTTKPFGEGTGLGLSISYGIVSELGGEISFESEVGVGTTFTLRFPLARDKHDQ